MFGPTDAGVAGWAVSTPDQKQLHTAGVHAPRTPERLAVCSHCLTSPQQTSQQMSMNLTHILESLPSSDSSSLLSSSSLIAFSQASGGMLFLPPVP